MRNVVYFLALLVGLAGHPAHAQVATVDFDTATKRLMAFAEGVSYKVPVPLPASIDMADASDLKRGQKAGFAKPPYMDRSVTESGDRIWTLIVDQDFLTASETVQEAGIAFFMCIIHATDNVKLPPGIQLTGADLQSFATECTFDTIGESKFADLIMANTHASARFAEYRGLPKTEVIAKLRQKYPRYPH